MTQQQQPTFVPLSLELIEEGTLVADANSELLRLQQNLRHFVEVHGPAAKGAISELTIKIKIKAEETKTDQEWFSVSTEMPTKEPARPKVITKAMPGFRQEDNTPVILVRQGGSNRFDPRQGELFDGQKEDQQQETPND